MFDGPEYASYRDLMRELRLERRARAGDWLVRRDPNERPDIPEDIRVCGSDGYECGDAPFWDDSYEVVWLPRLDQWLSRYTASGERSVSEWFDEMGAYLAQCPGTVPEEAAAHVDGRLRGAVLGSGR